ncbi:MAG TPA: replication/maintenance protein RepL [Phycisphaerae bacterium]|nr:replication/maintenance protein RepL [Phycisphaerae bacterium]
MRQIAALPDNQVSTKRGFPVYRTNPSVPTTNGITTRTKRFQVPGGRGSVIVDNSSGEIKGIGGMGFWWEEEVDSSRFVKMFLDGIKQAADLSKTGLQVFELVYHEMRANPGSDEIKLNQYVAKDHGISDRTYQRGVRELLEKEFLYRSPSDGVFFVNIRFMFNGDRLAFVRTYHLKGASRQQELQLGDTAALPSPVTEAADAPVIVGPVIDGDQDR